jgi:hypothetical protein
MVAESAVHPVPERLAAFLTGRLDEAEPLQVEQHLSHCESCRQVLESLPDGSLDLVLRSPDPWIRRQGADAGQNRRRVAAEGTGEERG